MISLENKPAEQPPTREACFLNLILVTKLCLLGSRRKGTHLLGQRWHYD